MSSVSVNTKHWQRQFEETDKEIEQIEQSKQSSLSTGGKHVIKPKHSLLYLI